VTRGEAAQPEK